MRFRRFCDAQIRAGRRLWVEQRRDDAMSLIAGAGGIIGEIQTGSIGGKSFAMRVDLDCAEVASLAQEALDEADGCGSGATGFTVPDFNPGAFVPGYPCGWDPDPQNC